MTEECPTATARTVKRRARVSHACVACQQKKQKCDGQTPACRNCLRANRTCVSQDPSTQRSHPRGYIEFLEQHNASLENHVALLERSLQERQSNAEFDNARDDNDYRSGSGEDNHENGMAIASMQVTTPSQASPLHPVSSEQVTDDLSAIELLCLRSAGAEPHFFGASSGYSFAKMFSANLRAVRRQGPGLTMSGIADKTCVPQPCAMPIPLPNRSVVDTLRSSYFDQVHPQFPFLHQPSYQQWEDEVMAVIESGKTPDANHAFFVYIVCAIGALTGPLAGGALPEGLYAAAQELFEHVMQGSGIVSIQATLACAMYSLRSPVGVSIWMLSGLALRQCLELGLHRKIRWAKVESNHIKTELRMRVFWCAYNLDRAVAITLGRPVGIADHDIDIEYPSDINDEDITVGGLSKEPRSSPSEPATVMSSAIHTLRLRHLWAQMQNAVYSQGADTSSAAMTTIQQFKCEFRAWQDSAPEQLVSNRANNNAFGSREWYSLMYHHSILLLYRRQLVPGSAGAISPIVYTDCAHSAQSICMIYRQLYVSQRLTDTWGALHVLFLAAVTFLHCLWSSPESRAIYRADKVSSICTSGMVVLAIMAERWTAVEAYRDAFEMLASATQTMLAETAQASVPPQGPVIPQGGYDQFSSYLSFMDEVGMCSSVEELLANMVE